MCNLGKAVAGAAFALASLVTAAVSDEYKELTDSAYCAGVLRREIDLTKAMGENLDVRDKEQLLARKIAFLQGALRQQKIDTEISNKFVVIGEVDAQLCWDIVKKCFTEASKRAEKNVDLDSSQRMLENCSRPAEAACTRTEACH